MGELTWCYQGCGLRLDGLEWHLAGLLAATHNFIGNLLSEGHNSLQCVEMATGNVLKMHVQS